MKDCSVECKHRYKNKKSMAIKYLCRFDKLGCTYQFIAELEE